MLLLRSNACITQRSQGIPDVFVKHYGRKSYQRMSATTRWLRNCFRALLGS
jgi:hypothetical protein